MRVTLNSGFLLSFVLILLGAGITIAQTPAPSPVVQVPLLNQGAKAYFMNLFVGEKERTPLKLFVNLMNPSIVVADKCCEKCSATTKLEFTKDTCDKRTKNLPIGIFELSGRGTQYTSQVSLEKSGKVFGLDLVAMEELYASSKTTVHEIEDGYIGFGISVGIPPFMKQLKEKQIINDRIFSLFFSKNKDAKLAEDSYLTLGGSKEASFGKEGKKVEFYDVTSTVRWEVEVKPFVYGPAAEDQVAYVRMTFENSFEGFALDSDIHSSFVAAFQKVTKSSGCTSTADSLTKCTTCPADAMKLAPTLTIGPKEKGIEWAPSDYFTQEGTGCSLRIGRIPRDGVSPRVVTGLAFLQKYYTIYNVDTRKVGIVEAMDKPKSAGGNKMIMFIIGGAIAAVLVIGIIVMCVARKRQNSIPSGYMELSAK